MKFNFPEESIEMDLDQPVKIINSGNAPAKFFWFFSIILNSIRQLTNDNKLFSVSPLRGIVESKSTAIAYIKYKPTSSSGGKTEDEKLIMKVEDGADQVLKYHFIYY